MRTLLLVGLGGLLGSIARYGVSRVPVPAGLPWPTLIVNVAGSLLIGYVLARAAAAPHEPTRLFVATGFCGGFTTFSTFSFEALNMVQRGQWLALLAYAGLSLALGLGAAAVGFWVGTRAA